MDMPKAVVELLDPFSFAAHHDAARSDALEQIIATLEQRQEDLQARLDHCSNDAQRRHLKLDLEVTRLQYRKALALRTERR